MVALAASGSYHDASTDQIPKPIHHDPETHTIFMTDLGPVDALSKVLTEGLDGIHTNENAQSKLEEAYSLAPAFGSALGGFMARFHNWSASPERAGLRKRFSGDAAGERCAFSHLDHAVRSVARFGMNGPVVEVITRDEFRTTRDG